MMNYWMERNGLGLGAGPIVVLFISL
jgi:hypothetical protein